MNALRAFIGNFGLAMANTAGVRQTGPPEFAQLQVMPKLFSPMTVIPYAMAYEISPDVYACVSLLAQAIAGLELELFMEEGSKRTKIEWEPGNALDVWGNANPQQTDYEMVEAFVANLLTFGNTYLRKERMVDERQLADLRKNFAPVPTPLELWPIPAAFCIPIPGPKRTIREFYYRVRGLEYHYAPEDMVWGRYWTAGDELEGLTPLSVARWRYQTQENSSRYVNEMFKRGGGMQVMLSSKVRLDEEAEERFIDRINKRFRNVAKWFEPQFFPAEMTAAPLGQTLKDMNFVEVAKLTTTEIAKAYHVPADLIGVDKSGALNQASVESSMVLLYEFGVKPLLKRIERLLDERLWGDFGIATNGKQRVRCKFNTTRVLPLTKSFLEQAKALREIIGENFMAPSEGRDILELEERKDPGLDKISIVEPAPVTPPMVGPAGANPRPPQPPGARAERASIEPGQRQDALELQTERAEHQAEHLWEQILAEQQARILAALRPVFARRVDFPEIEEIVALLEDEHERDDVRGFLERLVESSGQSELDVLKAAGLIQAAGFDVSALAVRRFLKEHVDRAISVPNDTTRRMLRLSIGDAWQSGDGLVGVERAVQDVFDVRRANVATIARTEVVPALNFAAIEAYKQTGVVRELVWITARDDVVRAFQRGDEYSHAEMDGQVARIGELWHVPRAAGGTEALRYPGDPHGSPANIINCRCRVVANVPRAGAPRRELENVRVDWWFNEAPHRNGNRRRVLVP